MSSLKNLEGDFYEGRNEKKKISWVEWPTILASKEDGGLGIGSLRGLNLALLAKWIWRLKTKKDKLWCIIIRGIHNLDLKPMSKLEKKSLPGPWGSIMKIKDDIGNLGLDFESLFYSEIDTCSDTLFWHHH